MHGIYCKAKNPCDIPKSKNNGLVQACIQIQNIHIFTLINNLYKSCSLVPMIGSVWEETW